MVNKTTCSKQFDSKQEKHRQQTVLIFFRQVFQYLFDIVILFFFFFASRFSLKNVNMIKFKNKINEYELYT